MPYKVIRPFKDLSDPEKHDYALDDVFPRAGYSPSEDFVNGLLTGSNSAGSIFLALVDETPKQEPELPEATEEEVPAEKPKRKRTTKKAEV